MLFKSIVLFVLFIILLSTVINGYRLDSLSHLSDIDEANELTDPYLIHRLQSLLAAAAASKRGNIRFNDYFVPDHILSRRFVIMDRRPGLLRLK